MIVLVAHADSDVRGQVAARLRVLGHEVDEAADGETALRSCRDHEPAVMLLGDDLRTASGAGVLDAVKRDGDAFRVAVVLLGAEVSIDEALGALRRGAQDLLAVPSSEGELMTRVVAAERTKILQQELAAQGTRLENLIFGDELTGLPNRRFLLTQLHALASGARRHERPLSVVMLDVDFFKRINDTHGHAAGDAVLAAIATTLRERLREEDWLGRMGGEEFLALLPDQDAGGAEIAAEALRSAVEHMGVRVDEKLLRCTLSAGWATLERDEEPEMALRRADAALYEAKAAGRNRVLGAATLRPRL